MSTQLDACNYLCVPGFITPAQAAELALGFEAEAAALGFGGDSQIPQSQASYNHLPFVRLLVEKIPQVSKLVGSPVLPTYTYARVHNDPGVELRRHRDRPACEISLTVNLAKTAAWPICFQRPDGVEVCVDQTPGDAVLYLGCVADHWRPPYTGDHHIQVFLHYVRAYGEFSWAVFDKLQ
jgi:hypothetical protein